MVDLSIAMLVHQRVIGIDPYPYRLKPPATPFATEMEPIRPPLALHRSRPANDRRNC